MPITGPNSTLLYAIGGHARGGATRGGLRPPHVCISVAGEHRAAGKSTASYVTNNLTIQESRSDTPNQATVDCKGWEPSYGDEVIITLGTINSIKRIFAGTTISVRERNSKGPDNRTITLNAVDYSWLLDEGEKVTGHFTGSATDIVLELMTTYAPAEFTVRRVEADLPTVTNGITFTKVPLYTALGRLANRIGATRYVDYRKDLYFRVTPLDVFTNPTDVTRDLSTLKTFEVSRGLGQQITRVYMEGGGSTAATEVAVGETIIPLLDAPETWYGDFGGTVVSGPQRISYTERFQGGGGSLIGPGAAPTVAPTLALAAGSGVTVGSHDVAVVFETGSGTSLPGPTATIDVGTVAAPETAPLAGAPTVGAGPDAGDHYYAVTFVTAAGETDASPVSGTVTTTVVAAPSSAWTIGVGIGSTSQWSIGDSIYIKAVYVTEDGTTTPGAQSATWVATANALNPSLANSLNVVGIESPDLVVSGIRVYVNRNGSWIGYYDLPNQTYSFNVGTTAPTAGSPPSSNTAAIALVPLTNIPNSSSALVTSKKLYGTAAGAAQLKLVATLTPLQTTYEVALADASLGANVPTSNTAAAGQITAGFPVGPTGTTARRLYMSLAGGGARKLALTVSNNTAVEGTITASDATLSGAGAEPSTDTSGLAQPDGQVLAGATSIPVAGFGEHGLSENGGWAIIGTGRALVRYTGIFESSIIGIPSSGVGSIETTIAYNSQITAAPALMGCGRRIVFQRAVNNVSRALRLATSTATDRLGMEIGFSIEKLSGVVFKFTRVGAVTGNVWVTLQTGSVSTSGTVLATSNIVDVSTLGKNQPVAFEWSPVNITYSGSPPYYFLVLHGDYTRSDSVHVLLMGDSVGAANASQYDGTTVTQVSTVRAWWFQLLQELTLLRERPSHAFPIVATIPKGQDVNLLVMAEDQGAQFTRQIRLNTAEKTGIRVAELQDRTLGHTEALARATAHLEQRKVPEVSATYLSKDINNSAGREVDVSIIAPTNVHDTLRLQRVTISNFHEAQYPDYQVEASTDLFTIEDLLRQGRTK